VLRQYDYSDISDRYDLLATLFAEAGDLDRAVSTLRDSKAFCEAHGVAFDGGDLLAEYEQMRQAEGENLKDGWDQASLDAAIVEVYPELRSSADAILTDDDLSRRFVRGVQKRLGGTGVPSSNVIKKRLLNLRRQGSLPQLDSFGVARPVPPRRARRVDANKPVEPG
jgi:hypothetical protein